MNRSLRIILGLVACAVAIVGIRAGFEFWERRHAFNPLRLRSTAAQPAAVHLTPFQQVVLTELDRQIHADIHYQDGYFDGGDPPAKIGVCSDVVIRALRVAGLDLQRAVADDIRASPAAYDITKPDRGIDHRRVRNLIVWFRHHAKSLPTDGGDADWQPGDVVFWSTHNDKRADHVGLVANGRDSRGEPTIIHHWPGLPVCETDGLHRFPVLAHFRWTGAVPQARA